MAPKVYVVGVGMTKFGKFLDKGMKQMTGEVLDATKNDVMDEVSQLDSIEEDVDFDQDENEVDMTLLSPAMREAVS